MAGGEPRALTDIPRGAGNPAWSPDGQTIAFASWREARRADQDGAEARREAARERRPRHHRARCIARTAWPAAATWIAIGRPRSGRSACPADASDAGDAAAASRPASSARATIDWSTDGSQILLRLRPAARIRTTSRSDSDLYAVSQGRRRTGARRQHRRRASAPTRSSPTASASRSSARSHGNPSRSYQPAGSLGRRSAQAARRAT